MSDPVSSDPVSIDWELRVPAAKDFVRRSLLLMNQRADTDVIEAVARQIAFQLRWLDGNLKPRYACGYSGCEDLTGIPHGHN